MMSFFKPYMVVLAVIGLVIAAYFVGKNAAVGPVVESITEPKNLEEVARINTEFDRQQALLTNRVADIKNRIETVKVGLNISEHDSQIESKQIAERLEALNEERLKAQGPAQSGGVSIPLDSPDGRILNQTRTASGMSQQVLDRYEQETGVSPQEVEELMRRTE